jgi:CDP-ribitol ribitolphosphotransferase
VGSDSLRERRKAEKEIMRAQKRLRKIEQHESYLYTFLWPALYKRYSILPIIENQILFASSSSSALTPDLRPVFNYLNNKGYSCKFIGKFEYNGPNVGSKIAEFIYYRHFFKHYGRCKCLYLDDTFLPAYSQRARDGQQLVQLWHTFGILKKWGYAPHESELSSNIIDKRPMHNTYTAVSVASDAAKPSFSSAFSCGEEILHAWGVPKTDKYFNKAFVKGARDELIKCVPNLMSRIDGRKILLYAPTYRGSQKSPVFHRTLDYALLKRLLGDDYVLLQKRHPYIEDTSLLPDHIKSIAGDFAFEISAYTPIETALCGADMLITDYSSVMFEYSLLERPQIFYAYDLHRYKKEREFFVSYERFVPGAVVFDSLMLADAVKCAETDFNYEKLRHFRRKYMGGCDGRATGRVINFTVNGG